jgi:hypothetical protein
VKKPGMLFVVAFCLLAMGAARQMPGPPAAHNEKNSQPIAPPTFYKDVLPILQISARVAIAAENLRRCRW